MGLLLLVAQASPHHDKPSLYPYRSAAFDTLIADSYKLNPEAQPFYDWLESTYAKTPAAKLPGQPNLSLVQALEARQKAIAATSGARAKSELELDTAAWLHKLVKATIPRFSLERGFEFTNTVTLGERQCLLQSVLIVGLLQRMGLQAGAYMVWKNHRGQVSNLGHVAAVLKLSDGRDVLVDASEKEPFFRHQGLFGLVNGEYRFIEPVYSAYSTITAYKVLSSGEQVRPLAVKPLDTSYVRSQFYYYRGERAPGGFMGNPKTPEGLAKSEQFLLEAIRLAPQNPLAVYVLGHVYLREKKTGLAEKQYQQGCKLYRQYGYLPDGPKAACTGL